MPTQMGAQYGEEIFPNLGATVARVGEQSVGEINKRTDLAMQQELYRQRMLDLWNTRNAGMLERTEENNKTKEDIAGKTNDTRVKTLHSKIEGGHQPGDEWSQPLAGNIYAQPMKHYGYDEDGDPIVKPVGLPQLTEYGKAQTKAIPVKAEAAKKGAEASVTRAEKEVAPKGLLSRAQYDTEVDGLLKKTGRSLLMAKDANDAKKIATQALDDLHNKHNAANGVDDATLTANENALKAKYEDAISSFGTPETK